MKQPKMWNRRRFLQMSAGASLFSLGSGQFGRTESIGTQRDPRFAYVGSENSIHVYKVTAQGFIQQQTVPSPRPTAMAISNAHLYVANGVSQCGHLPCGSVRAYAMDSATGRLEQKNVVPLSLSATAPRDLAVSPDGCSLIVAVHGGGAYNLLRIEEDGQLGKVSSILKEIGSGPHPSQSAAHPAAVVFDRAGRVLAADQGSDRLSVLSIDRGALGVAGRWELAAGSGPTGMVLHPHGEQVYVAHALNGSISAFSYDATGALHQNWTVHVQAAGDVAELAMHPSGELLFSTHGTGVQAWKAAADGDLEPLSINRQVKARKLYAMPDCDSLLVLTDDAVLRMKIDVQRGVLADPVVMASLPQPLSIAAL